MATDAQVAANRLNAQKSTGPRTAEGKAVVAQNAVKHGLLAREGLLRGEDREEYETHREALLEELKPTGALEVMLAARIVNLTWRLYRAAQNQDETFGALYDRYTAGTPEPAGAAQRGAILGRMILEDYSGGAVLERLLRCERRIEGSLFRNLSELRRVNDQRRNTDAEAASTLARWREEDDQAWKAQAFAPWRPADSPSRPDGPTMGTPGLEAPRQGHVPSGPDTPPTANAAVGHEMCQTNPIGGGVSSWKAVGAGPRACPSGGRPRGVAPTDRTLEPAAQPQSCETKPIGAGNGLVPWGESVCQAPTRTDEVGRGRPSYEETPGGVTTSAPADQLCETNPIGPEPNASQVQYGTGVRSVSAREGLGRTNPIGSAPGGTGIPAVGSDHGRACSEPVEEEGHDIHGQDARDTHGRDAHATG